MDVSAGEAVCIGLFVVGLAGIVMGASVQHGCTQVRCTPPVGDFRLLDIDLSQFYYHYYNGCNECSASLVLPAGILANLIAAAGLVYQDHAELRDGLGALRRSLSRG